VFTFWFFALGDFWFFALGDLKLDRPQNVRVKIAHGACTLMFVRRSGF